MALLAKGTWVVLVDGEKALICENTGTTRAPRLRLHAKMAHLRDRTDVQNIDMMNLTGFCRNCLSRWYQEEAEIRGVAVDREAAREIVYGMPYGEWKARHQTEASAEAQTAFDTSFAQNVSGKAR